MSGVKSVTIVPCRDQKRVFIQVTVDYGFQLLDFGSKSPDCDVSLTYPLDRRSWPWHISYVIVEQ